jgi:hypothetical protein
MGRAPTSLGRYGLTVAAWALVACQVDGATMDSGFYDPAGSATAASTTATLPSGDTGAETDGASGSDTEVDTTDAGSSSDGGSDGASSTGSDPTDTDGGGTGGATEQPASGMYSECTSAVDCVGQTQCVTTDDGMDGYCSSSCLAPAMDCDDAPGGSAPVICAMMTGGPTAVCALDCSVGQQCPTGMSCQTTADGTFCI